MLIQYRSQLEVESEENIAKDVWDGGLGFAYDNWEKVSFSEDGNKIRIETDKFGDDMYLERNEFGEYTCKPYHLDFISDYNGERIQATYKFKITDDDLSSWKLFVNPKITLLWY